MCCSGASVIEAVGSSELALRSWRRDGGRFKLKDRRNGSSDECGGRWYEDRQVRHGHHRRTERRGVARNGLQIASAVGVSVTCRPDQLGEAPREGVSPGLTSSNAVFK